MPAIGAMALSLHRQLFRRLTLPLLLLLIVEGFVSHRLALHFSERAYDAGLYGAARDLSGQMKFVSGRAILDLPREALEIIRWDVFDRIFFAVDSARHGLMVGDSGFPQPPESLAERMQPFFYDASFRGERIRAVAVRLRVEDDEITVYVGETLTKRGRLTRDILLAMLLPGLILTLTFLWLLQRGIRGGLAPLHAAVQQIERRSPSDLNPVADTGPLEVQPLIRALNVLLRALSDAQASQRRFIANAAHQLRTPLAALQVQSERALRELDPTAHAQALQHVASATNRVAHISRQLLMLARAEPEANARQRFGEFDVAALAREITSEWVPQALEQGADLGYAGPESPVRMNGNAMLLHELLSNLIDNALRYGKPAGKVTVGVCSGAQVQLSVEDDGPGIPPDARERVFDRFVRLSTGEGCGLGLAIVREIAALHGGEVRINDVEGSSGVRVTIMMPRNCIHER